MRFHFLHIGKTGGSAIRSALKPFCDSHSLVIHRHGTVLRDIPDNEKVIFFVRDPVSRFVSGFNSRLRRGRPLNNSPWSIREYLAFSNFSSPNQLAEALSSHERAVRWRAQSAMRAISHVNTMLIDWLESADYIQKRRASISVIGFQETLSSDFESIKRAIGLPANLTLPQDPILAHKTPHGFQTALTDLGRKNLTAWYAADVTLVEFLRQLKLSQENTPANVTHKTVDA